MRKMLIAIVIICMPSICNSEDMVMQEVRRGVNSFKMELPTMIDKVTRCDSVWIVDREINYKMTIINYKRGRINIAKLKKSREPAIINSICTTQETMYGLKNGLSYNIIYYSSDEKEVFRININRVKCGY
jgi:hypothetical protein